MRLRENLVLIDVGETEINSIDFGSTKILLPTEYSKEGYRRLSGKVTMTTDRVVSNYKFDGQYRIEETSANIGDIVFFDRGVYQYVDRHGYKLEQDGSNSLIFPYNKLICRLLDDGSVETFNGKVLGDIVNNFESKGVIDIICKENLDKVNYFKVKYCETKEEISGIYDLPSKSYNWFAQPKLKAGDVLLVSDYADYDIDVDNKLNTRKTVMDGLKCINPESMIGVLRDGNISPLHNYCKIELIDPESSSVIIERPKRIVKCKIVEIGGSVTEVSVGDVVTIKNKYYIFDGTYAYIPQRNIIFIH